jgi:hypothetical protein
LARPWSGHSCVKGGGARASGQGPSRGRAIAALESRWAALLPGAAHARRSLDNHPKERRGSRPGRAPSCRMPRVQRPLQRDGADPPPASQHGAWQPAPPLRPCDPHLRRVVVLLAHRVAAQLAVHARQVHQHVTVVTLRGSRVTPGDVLVTAGHAWVAPGHGRSASAAQPLPESGAAFRGTPQRRAPQPVGHAPAARHMQRARRRRGGRVPRPTCTQGCWWRWAM